MSLKKISELTGVSVSTVSRILSGKNPKCASEKVKQAVWEAARELNYVPNSAARSLRSSANPEQEPPVIYIVYARLRDTDTNYFFTTMVRAVSEEIVQQGCRTGQVFYIDELIEHASEITSRDGLVILGRCDGELLRKLESVCKNIVCVGLNPFDPAFDRVICDGAAAAEMAMNYLIRHRHERIGYVGECGMEVRFIGYCNVLRRNDISFDPDLIYETTQSEEGGRRVARRVLETRHMPTALFCANDSTAIGLLSEMKQLQKRGPYPALISIDNIATAQDVTHLLTTINIPIRQMGSMAAKLLLDRMHGGHWYPVLIQFPCNLIRRETS